MGPLLRGATPPFTPSGKAAILRSRLGEADINEPIQAGHVGLLLRWRTHRRNAEELLPPPLEPVPDTDIIYCFLNQTQTGLNMFRPKGATGTEYLRGVDPHHVNWHEGMFWILCSFQGMSAHYSWQSYKDVDHGVLLGLYNGYTKKLATFDQSFPMAAQPLQPEMGPGAVAHMAITRFGEPVITARFLADRELGAEEIGREVLPERLFGNSISIRFFPDCVHPTGPPLVHQLVLRQVGGLAVPRAWAGRAEITLGPSRYLELSLVEPLEALESYFIYLQYTSGPVAAQCKVLHDYVAAPTSVS